MAASGGTAGLFIGHHRGPDAIRVEVLAGRVEERRGIGFAQPRGEAFADQAALPVAPIGVESVAHDTMSVALHVGHHGDQACCHLREIDIGVADR